MKSHIKLPKSRLQDFIAWLEDNKYEVNTTRVSWRVMLFRSKNEPIWTQGYDGKTRPSLAPRDFIRFAGPEANLVTTYLNLNPETTNATAE